MDIIEIIKDLVRRVFDIETIVSEGVGGGTVTLVPRGEYDNATAYVVNDTVSYATNGNSYICKADSTGNLPTDTTYWQILSKKGDTGAQGIQGIQGVAGANGADGTDGADGLGVPAGGTTGQVLKKTSNADNDTEWGSAGLDTLQVVLSSQVFN